jgi:ribonuclease P protein component
MRGNSLKRNDMLKSKIQIDLLFKNGVRLSKYPLKIILLPVNDSIQQKPCSLIVMASANKYKKAIVRNRIKRLLKDIYRNNKSLFYPYLTQYNKKCQLGIMYNGNEIPTFGEVEESMVSLLKRIPEMHEKYNK